MALVTVTINGYAHTVGCEDGQETHLRAMAAAVDQRVQSVKAVAGQGNEAQLLVLAALMLADELHDMRAEADALRMSRAPEVRLARKLGKLASKAEEIALNLEHP
jgi:cell division protein ZapA